MWQNPQITDGLRSQAVEGKVQELWRKDIRWGNRSTTRDNDAHTGGGSWLLFFFFFNLPGGPIAHRLKPS